MGYSQGASAAALRQTNNDLNQALEVSLQFDLKICEPGHSSLNQGL